MFMRVKHEDRDEYIEFTTDNHEEWVKEGHMLKHGNLDRLNPVGFHPYISNSLNGSGFWPDVEREEYFCAWHMSPPPTSYGLLNWNIVSYRTFADIFAGVIALKNESLVSPVGPYVAVPTALTFEEHAAMHSKLIDSEAKNPHSFVYTPIHEVVGDHNSEVVAIIGTGTAWDAALLNLLPDNVAGIVAVIRNDCNQSYTYEIVGKDAFYLGEGDIHEDTKKYEHMKVEVNLALHTHPNFTSTPGHCQYTMALYPTDKFKSAYDSNTPEIFAGVVAATFFLIIAVFFIYDMTVKKRNNKMVTNMARSNAIVTSMFPSNIRDRLIGQNQDGTDIVSNTTGKRNLKSMMLGGTDAMKQDNSSKPLAALFLETTIVFADIVGFTAWSSVREPSQVFTLLESVYQEFDAFAKRRRVFKVETVGDCYVAVAGIPIPKRDHAVAMARFGRDIMIAMGRLTNELEVALGPDTGDLTLRIGMHSGPVTAGVLRGERARFQLFGDTMNTTSRIESTSQSGRIHVSQEAADCLTKCGKGHWLTKRDEVITARGKGDLVTYWLSLEADETASAGPAETGLITRKPFSGRLKKRESRLVEWNVETFLKLLRQLEARRNAYIDKRKNPLKNKKLPDEKSLDKGETFLDEVKEIMRLPEFNSKEYRKEQDPDTIAIDPCAVDQLREYITLVAGMYRNNPFHNFEHASHVCMSVIKLLSRIVAPAEVMVKSLNHNTLAAELHDHTYGITSDPMTQFAAAFSALIHDVDHTGVGNPQLCEEDPALAKRYKSRSVAEQNSLGLAWDLLMEDRFKDFRAMIYRTNDELRRFRELVVNCVMATDIMDKDLKGMRNARWEKAFKGSDTNDAVPEQSITADLEQPIMTDPRDAINRKATIVMEHLIQASDISHTMQHWHVYRKWNERLFEELYAAFRAGRSKANPADFWAKGEIGFFDFYIIPLAKKLKDCGVFGKSSDEFLNYAEQNRKEWIDKGEEIVAEMVEKFSKKTYVRGNNESCNNIDMLSCRIYRY